MDLDLTADQQQIAELADRILGDLLPPEQIALVEGGDLDPLAAAWAAMGQAGLLGLSAPVADGGAGLGMVESVEVAVALGRAAAPLPFDALILGAALTIADVGTDAQRTRFLGGLLAGTAVVSSGLVEDRSGIAPEHPHMAAASVDEGWRLTGELWFVPLPPGTKRVLVSADTGAGNVGLFLLDPNAISVSVTELETTTFGRPVVLELDAVLVRHDDVLGDPLGGAEARDRWLTRSLLGVCAETSGLCEGAVALTGQHLSTREQFGSKIGTFQAAAHRAADAWIDAQAIMLTTRQAAWRIDEGLDAAAELSIASWWAAEGGFRVVHAAQHLHGGTGVDTDYPLHRYFRRVRELELTLGGAAHHLDQFGADIAELGLPVR